MFIPINTAPSLATMAILAAITIVEDAIPKSREDAKRKLGAVVKIVATLAKETLKRKVGKPLLEDAELTLACLQERVEGNFLKVQTVSAGTVVICSLAKGITHHSGIWLENGTISELDGDGNYRAVNLETFLRGNEGERWRAGTFAYAACSLQGQPLGSNDVAEIAQSFLGKKTKYSVDANNCHRFSTACHSGGEAENVFRPNETFSVGKLLNRILCFHNKEKIRWIPIVA
ncbi:MAG: hypothetical protein J6L64_04190 [Opitutales bacterium]|nr:hypothetical protein [Opitutales bacterium]